MIRTILVLSLLIVFKASLAQTDTLRVDVIYPSESQQSQQLVLTGNVEAKQNAQLAPLESGLVSTLYVEVGDVVEQGARLLSLDDKLVALEVEGAQASVNAARVSLAEAKRLYEEVLSLSKKQVVAQTLIAERAAFMANAEAQLARAVASLKRQQEVLKRHVLLAPFSGVITQRNVDIGEWVSQQSSVLSLVAQQDLRVSIAIPQEYYSRLIQHKNLALSVIPDTSAKQPISATLSRIVPVSDSMSRTFLAQVDLPSDSALVPGMSARVDITLPNTNQSMVELPRSAIKQHPDGGSSVFIVENNRAKRVITVYTQLANGNVAIENKQNGATYIVTGIELLSDGMAVLPNTIKRVPQ